MSLLSKIAFPAVHNSSFDPQTLVLLETAFDEAWLTLKSVGNRTVKPDELARTPYQRAEALRCRAAGENLTEIAKSFNVSHMTIARLGSD